MDQRDRMIGMLGVLMVVVSAAGGVAFATGPMEDGGEGEADYVVVWSQSTRTISEVGLNSQVLEVTVPQHNLTQLTVRLTWTDDELVSPIGQRDDILTLRVGAPPDLDEPDRTETGTGGELVTTYDLAPVPTSTDPGDLEALDYANATGEWTITVTVEPQGLRDTGNDWTVIISYGYYTGQLSPAPEES